MKTLKLVDKMSTGKCKNKTVKYIASIDIPYLLWLHNSMFNIVLDKEVLKYIGVENNYKSLK